MNQPAATLYYVHDPMCSWCWGFVPVWGQVRQQIGQQLQDRVCIRYLLGGLAADSDEPMPAQMQASIRDNWRRIQQQIPGIRFNEDFWTRCQPRRSTYPACRAVIACRMQQADKQQQMLTAIQQAYYLHAMNPSDDEVLLGLASDIGLDVDTFAIDLNSDACQQQLEAEISSSRELGVYSFPSLVLLATGSADGDHVVNIEIDYLRAEPIVQTITATLDTWSQDRQ